MQELICPRITRMTRVEMGAQWTVFIAGQGDETFGEFGQFVPADGALAFFGTQLGFGNEPAEILIAAARFNQHRENAAVFHGQLGANDRTDSVFLSGSKKTRS